MTFKVESRKICACGNAITENRFRKFCSKACRDKSYAGKYQAYRSKYQQEHKDAEAMKPSPNKMKCFICERYYVQIGTHVVQRHGMTAREYREAYNLPLKRGIVPPWYRKLKGDQALENKTVENLKEGRKFHYKKGDKRAKIGAGKHGWKSQRRPADEYYI